MNTELVNSVFSEMSQYQETEPANMHHLVCQCLYYADALFGKTMVHHYITHVILKQQRVNTEKLAADFWHLDLYGIVFISISLNFVFYNNHNCLYK